MSDGCSPAEARNTAVFHLYSRVFRGELAIDAVIDSFRLGKLGAESQNRSETTVEFVRIPRPGITEHVLQLRQNPREILVSGTGLAR